MTGAGSKHAPDARSFASCLDEGVFRNGDGVRRSPVEIVANMASYVTRTPVADRSGLRGGWFGRWTDGVVAMRGDCVAFASHWELHNDRIVAEIRAALGGAR